MKIKAECIPEPAMKRIVLMLLTSLSVLCGCAHNYVITLDNGRRITTASKPKLKGEKYVFKDGAGGQGSVSAGRVREIAPASMANDDKPKFNSQPKKK